MLTDLTRPQVVEVVIDQSGKRVWVNVQGAGGEGVECVFRASGIERLILTDDREPKKTDKV